MADVVSNRRAWEEGGFWDTEGDEWSTWWGGTHPMWLGAIQPRLQSFIPAGTILEIAPGYGRWTQYLKDLADDLVVVDLTEGCIDHCRARFADATNIDFHVNDGRSLDMVGDDSIDLVVSLDSLVHVDPSVLDAYLEQLADKLTADGVGFIHHSNAGSYRDVGKLVEHIPDAIRNPLVERGVLMDRRAWRDTTMTAELFQELCHRHGLSCVGQEKLSWEHGRFLIDTFSVFTRPGSKWDRPHRVHENPGFSAEGKRMRTLWAPSTFAHQA